MIEVRSIKAATVATSTITESVSPVVAKLYEFSAGLIVSIIVAFLIAKLVPSQTRTARRALFSIVTFVGFLVTWYVVFYPAQR